MNGVQKAMVTRPSTFLINQEKELLLELEQPGGGIVGVEISDKLDDPKRS